MAAAYTIRKLTSQLEEFPARMETTRIFQPRPRPKIVTPPDSSANAFHRVQQLLTGSKVEKKGEILTGSPQSQVEGIVSFLLENGFLESKSTQ